MVSVRGSSVIAGGAICCAAGFSEISERGPGDGGLERAGSPGRVDGEPKAGDGDRRGPVVVDVESWENSPRGIATSFGNGLRGPSWLVEGAEGRAGVVKAGSDAGVVSGGDRRGPVVVDVGSW